MTRHRHLSLLCCWSLWVSAMPGQEPASAPETVQLRGRVVTWQGRPIAGAGVAFAPASSLTTARLLAEPPVRTDAEGRFTLTVPALVGGADVDTPVLLLAAKGAAAANPSVKWKYEPQAKVVGKQDAPRAPARRLDTDIGDVVLLDGVRLIGRVRDVAGKGIAGVAVTARDLLDGHRNLPGPTTQVFCRAVTDASGIFELPCALPFGMSIDFAAPGFLRGRLEGTVPGAPLEITMQPSERVLGRVVGADGAIVPGALVRASYERSGATTPVRAGDDGRFELPLEHAGRFRVSASRPRPPAAGLTPVKQPVERAESDVMERAAANLELVLKAPAAAAAPAGAPAAPKLRVQAVAADGKPIAEFRAAAVWNQFAAQNASYLDYSARHSARDAEGGEVMVSGPGEGEPTTGIVVVIAPGFAPAYVRDVEWSEATAATDKPVVATLVPEATIKGRVVDDSTGAPIAGVKITVQQQVDPSRGQWSAGEDSTPSVTTAADGTFVIGQLGEGDWALQCLHPERPKGLPVDVTLARSEQKVDLVVKMIAGARVAGRITGMVIPTGAKVMLDAIGEPRFSNNYLFRSTNTSQPMDLPNVPVAADGSFTMSGIALKSFYLVLELPVAPRCGGAVYVPLEPLRVRPGGVVRDIDAGQDLPGRIAGVIRYPRAVPTAALPVVVAEQLADDEQQQHFFGGNQYSGPRAFVAADGTFTLPLVRGRYRLRVVDAVTGLVMAAPTERFVVASNAEVRAELAVPLTELVVQLQGPKDPGALACVDRIEVRHEPAVKEGGGMVVFGGNSDEYDMGSGLPVPFGTTSLRLWLPEGKVTLFARGGIARLQRDGQVAKPGPLAREEFELAATEPSPREVTLRLTEVPSLDAPEVKPDADAGKR